MFASRHVPTKPNVRPLHSSLLLRALRSAMAFMGSIAIESRSSGDSWVCTYPRTAPAVFVYHGRWRRLVDIYVFGTGCVPGYEGNHIGNDIIYVTSERCS